MHDSISHNLALSRKLITDVKSALHKKELTCISGNTQPPPPFLYHQNDQWIPHFDSCQLTTTWMCNIRLQAITLYLFIYQHSGHRPAQRECARVQLRSYARCHPYPIPQHIKVATPPGSMTTTLFE